VRNSLRERELAVRAALGAHRWDLIRRVLAESLLLAGLGTATGLGLAWTGVRALRSVAPPRLPRLDEITLDPAVVGFAALAGLAAAALFGFLPAIRAARPDVIRVLGASSHTAGIGGSPRLRTCVVIAEGALTFVLLIGSGLMVRSFAALHRIDPGYAPNNLLTFQLMGGGAVDPHRRAAFIRQVQNALMEVPGVKSATASFPFPLAGGFSPVRWGPESARLDPSKFQAADFQAVLPGYFETLRTSLIVGRTFTDADNAPERRLVIIDQMLAAKAFPGELAVGKRILVRSGTPEAESVEVIGVVAHQRQTSLADPGREQIYVTDGYRNHGFVRRWAVRTEGNPAQFAAAIRARIAQISSGLLVTEMQPMGKYIERAQAETRFSLLLIGVFAVASALLAGVGLYVVLATMVRVRTAEIGVRMAFGAAPTRIFRLVVGHGLRLSAVGIAIGLAAALAATRAMTKMLVEVKPTDPATYAAIVLVFLLVTALATWLPARRAAGLDPTEALRRES